MIIPINLLRPFDKEFGLIEEKFRRIALENLGKELKIALILQIIK
jgi:hypothetical protein